MAACLWSPILQCHPPRTQTNQIHSKNRRRWFLVPPLCRAQPQIRQVVGLFSSFPDLSEARITAFHAEIFFRNFRSEINQNDTPTDENGNQRHFGGSICRFLTIILSNFWTPNRLELLARRQTIIWWCLKLFTLVSPAPTNTRKLYYIVYCWCWRIGCYPLRVPFTKCLRCLQTQGWNVL